MFLCEIIDGSQVIFRSHGPWPYMHIIIIYSIWVRTNFRSLFFRGRKLGFLTSIPWLYSKNESYSYIEFRVFFSYRSWYYSELKEENNEIILSKKVMLQISLSPEFSQGSFSIFYFFYYFFFKCKKTGLVIRI